MTTDFVVTVDQTLAGALRARTVKLAKDLQNQRLLEKLEMARQYWQSRTIDGGLVTEREIPAPLASNGAWRQPYCHSPARAPLSEPDVRRVSTAWRNRVLASTAALAEVAAACDDRLGWPAGTGRSVARHLIASRTWRVDRNPPSNPRAPLRLRVPVRAGSVEKIGGRS